MSYNTNEELIREFREAEKLLREGNAAVESLSDSGVTQRLAQHMRKWEEVIHSTLDTCEKEMKEATENTFTQATPHASPVERIRESLPAPQDPGELVRWSLKRHEELADWCGTLAKQSITDRTTELFQGLADQIRGINRQLASDTQTMEQG
ncbi:hypothetical protein P0Y35_17410 [Kiritimatiellaeota bacterium B1221]|nr:hypothetical protein [Kiritimatiellaeota bacterium B1221]